MSESKEISPITEFRQTVDAMGNQFLAALPQHVTVEKFKRTVITAVTMNADLLQADRRSLLASCMKAASDGLLLDNRDAALVKFGNEVQYMPMVGGILKRMRQSGEIKSVCTDVVYAGDSFDYWTDENGKHLKHHPAKESRGDQPTHAYAIINTKDGGVYIEVMDREQIDRVRAVSKTGKSERGPWAQWWSEMARKTVLRRLAKTAPMATDVADMLSRDDADNVDLGQETTVTQIRPTRPTRLAALAPSTDGANALDGAIAEDAAPVEAEPRTI